MIPYPADTTPVYAVLETHQFQVRKLEAHGAALEARALTIQSQSGMRSEGETVQVREQQDALLEARRVHSATLRIRNQKAAWLRGFAKYRRVLMRSLCNTAPHLFRQGDFIEFGVCSAYCLEYVHWRRAGLKPVEVLARLRLPANKPRVMETQKELKARYFQNMLRAPLARPQPFAAAAYVSAYTDHFERLRHGAAPHYPPAFDYPLSSSGALTLCGSVTVNFCIAMMVHIWPRHVFRTWDMTECVQAETDDAQLRASLLSTGPTAQTAPAAPVSVLVASDHMAARETKKRKAPLSTTVAESSTRPVLSEAEVMHWHFCEQQYLRWRGDLERELDQIFARQGKSGYLSCFLASAKWGHFVTIDLFGDTPGIFEPNYGFIALPASDHRQRYFHWVMAVLMYMYKAERVDFMYVPDTSGPSGKDFKMGAR